jgi:hypothetical protein
MTPPRRLSMSAMSKSEMDTTIGRINIRMPSASGDAHHNRNVDDWIHNRESGMIACLRVLYFYFSFYFRRRT